MSLGKKPSRSRTGCIIAVMIASFLFAVGVRDFVRRNFFRDHSSEARTNLGAIIAAQRTYFGKNDTYAGGEDCFTLIGWQPEGKTLYSYYCGDDVIRCTKPGCNDCGGVKLLGFTPVSTRSGFTLFAAGNIDWDSECDAWSMSDDLVLKRLKDDKPYEMLRR